MDSRSHDLDTRFYKSVGCTISQDAALAVLFRQIPTGRGVPAPGADTHVCRLDKRRQRAVNVRLDRRGSIIPVGVSLPAHPIMTGLRARTLIAINFLGFFPGLAVLRLPRPHMLEFRGAGTRSAAGTLT